MTDRIPDTPMTVDELDAIDREWQVPKWGSSPAGTPTVRRLLSEVSRLLAEVERLDRENQTLRSEETPTTMYPTASLLAIRLLYDLVRSDREMLGLRSVPERSQT